MSKLTTLALAVITAIILLLSVWQKAYADGFFVEGQINQNQDSNTDYYRWKNENIVPIEGIATLSLGYAVKPTDNTKVAVGVSHYSNPWTGNDYGGNGLFIKGCVGNGC